MADASRRVAAVTGGIVRALARRDFGVVVFDSTIGWFISHSPAAPTAQGARLAFASGDLLDVFVESDDLNLDVNTRGTLFPTQAVCRRMLAAESDLAESARRAVFILLSNAAIAAPEPGKYTIPNAAVGMIAQLYAVRSAPHGIANHGVRPGLMRTPMTRGAEARFDRPLADWFTPINRLARGRRAGGGDPGSGRPAGHHGAAIQVDDGVHMHQY